MLNRIYFIIFVTSLIGCFAKAGHSDHPDDKGESRTEYEEKQHSIEHGDTQEIEAPQNQFCDLTSSHNVSATRLVDFKFQGEQNKAFELAKEKCDQKFKSLIVKGKLSFETVQYFIFLEGSEGHGGYGRRPDRSLHVLCTRIIFNPSAYSKRQQVTKCTQNEYSP